MNRTEIPRASSVAVPAALAVVVRRGQALLAAKRPDFAELTSLVEIDPVLTGTVLRIVGCPVYAHADPAATPLGKSVEMVGRPALERIFNSLPMTDDDVPRVIEHSCRQWVQGLAVAAAARWIANQGEYEAPDEAYLAGLVHDVGRLHAPRGEDPRASAVRTHALVNAWNLGPRVAGVARWHHALAAGAAAESLVADDGELDDRTRRLLAIVARASALAAFLEFAGDGSHAAVLPGDPDAPAVREAIELEIGHAAVVLELTPSAPSLVVKRLVEHELRTRYEGEPEDAIVVSEARTAQRVAALHREIIDTRGVTAINDMIERGLRAIHERMEFDRLFLLEPDPDKPHSLRARLALDVTQVASARRAGGMELPLEAGGAIMRAFETEVACRGADRDLDREALERLGVSTFAVTPLRAGPASIGVVVVDQFLTGRAVSEGDAAVLSMLCSALGLAMENAALDAGSKKLRALAEKDELTGIDNRRNILAILQREIDRARRYGKPLSIAMVDVDHFKSWNDLHGHQVGDSVLQSVAQLISSCSREIDSYGRYGGEEFVIVLPETPIDHAMLYGERLRLTIENHGEVLRGRYPDTSLSISIGISSMSVRGDDSDKMIHRADAALYAAKKHGRNRVCVEVPNHDAPRGTMPSARGLLDEL